MGGLYRRSLSHGDFGKLHVGKNDIDPPYKVVSVISEMLKHK